MAIGGSPPSARGRDTSRGAAGRYAFVLEIGKGYLGPLWTAHDPGNTTPEGTVFVRHVAPIATTSVRAALLESARWGQGAKLPHSPATLEIVEGKTSLDLVTPAPAAEVLRTLLRTVALKHVPAEPALLLGIARTLLLELQALHDHAGASASKHAFGGVHPDSVLVDTEGRVMLLDVGLSAAASARDPWRADPQRMGFMAPEQLEARPVADARTDVFAVGAILWEALTNRRLFPGNDAKTVRERVQKGAIARLDATRSSASAGIATPIADLVARALERDPAARFATADEMARAIAALECAEAPRIGEWVTAMADAAIAKRRQVVERARAGVSLTGDSVPPPSGGAAPRQSQAPAAPKAPFASRAPTPPAKPPAASRVPIAPAPTTPTPTVAAAKATTVPEPSKAATPAPKSMPPRPVTSATPPPPSMRPAAPKSPAEARPSAGPEPTPRPSVSPPRPGTPPPPAAAASTEKSKPAAAAPPVEPTPVEPTPVEPTPVEPTPVEPAPVAERTAAPPVAERTAAPPVEPTPAAAPPVAERTAAPPVEPTPVAAPRIVESDAADRQSLVGSADRQSLIASEDVEDDYSEVAHEIPEPDAPSDQPTAQASEPMQETPPPPSLHETVEPARSTKRPPVLPPSSVPPPVNVGGDVLGGGAQALSSPISVSPMQALTAPAKDRGRALRIGATIAALAVGIGIGGEYVARRRAANEAAAAKAAAESAAKTTANAVSAMPVVISAPIPEEEPSASAEAPVNSAENPPAPAPSAPPPATESTHEPPKSETAHTDESKPSSASGTETGKRRSGDSHNVPNAGYKPGGI